MDSVKSPDEVDKISQEDIFEILLNTREQGKIMEQLIKNQIEKKDNMIDKLHKELEYYKEDVAGKIAEQLMKSVIKVQKDMKRLISTNKWEEMTIEDMKREYQYVSEDINDLLEQQNIDSYQSYSGDDFNSSIHQPKLEQTNVIELNKKIKESISDGYKKGDKVLIPERVIVYQYKEEENK